MPNHVQNHIKVGGDPQRVQEFLEKVQNDEYGIGTLDFQKIIPMPEDENDPYHWHIYNWGTKWNAYDYREDEDYSHSETLDFLTAWSAPHPILERLSEMFPELAFVHEWADEDLGVNCGRYGYADSERTEEYEPENERELLEFACSVWGSTPQDMGYVFDENTQSYYYNMEEMNEQSAT